jgi:hypothetical protein
VAQSQMDPLPGIHAAADVFGSAGDARVKARCHAERRTGLAWRKSFGVEASQLIKRGDRDSARLGMTRLTRRKIVCVRYLVRARVKPGREPVLLNAIENGTLGQGSVAEGEYLRNMQDARLCDDNTARWVEVCYCPTPLLEEQPYWEEYFDLVRVQDAHDRRRCRDKNGSGPWACGDCDCTVRLEQKLKETGQPFLKSLRNGCSSQPWKR